MLLAFDWSQLAQQTVIGLSNGSTWALLALAIVLIYRSTGVVNFAQGEMAMLSTFVAWSLVHHGLSYWAAFFLTVALSFAAGIGIERAVIRPVERAPVLTIVIVIVTLGLLFAVDGIALFGWAPETRSLRSAFSTRPVTVAGVAFSIADLATLGVCIGVVLLVGAVFRFTKLGLALRAAAVNPNESRLLGIRVSWMLAIGWGLAAGMGAVAGLLTAYPSFDQNFMQPVLLYALAGAVLGGLESPVGAVVGSLLLGVLVNLLGTYVNFVGNDLKLPVALAVILGILLVRPAGLFGRAAVRRV